MTSAWLRVLLAAAGLIVAVVPCASADGRASSLDDAWFESLARAESLLAGVSAGRDVDSVGHAAVAAQIRLGVHALGSLVGASILADTLLEAPIATVRPGNPSNRGWRNRFLRMTGVVSSAAALLSLAASMGHATPVTQRVLAYVGGGAAAIGGILHRSKEPQNAHLAMDSNEHIRMVGLASDLRDAIQESEREAETLWRELRDIALDSCATRHQTFLLARRYTNALSTASTLLESRVPRSATIALSCAQDPGFEKATRERFGALAANQVEVVDAWKERQWLFGRSKRIVLDYLALVDHP